MFTITSAIALVILAVSTVVTLLGIHEESIMSVKAGMIGLCGSMALYGVGLAIATIMLAVEFPPTTVDVENISSAAMTIGLVAMGLAMALGGGQQIVAIAKIK